MNKHVQKAVALVCLFEERTFFRTHSPESLVGGSILFNRYHFKLLLFDGQLGFSKKREI